MHEASLMTNLMRRIQEIASAEHAVRVVRVSVWLGALCHMSAGHFAEHFERAATGTIAAGAGLHVDVSDDTHHADAQDIVLKSVDVET
jgi:hydrogenase nickel incorporation protein HypA/HybF